MYLRSVLIASLALSACASAGAGTPPHTPLVTPDGDLCAGTPDDPRGERDPACAPSATHEPVEIVSHLAGCAPGVRGPLLVSLGGHHLATLLPGDKRAMRLPRGEVALTLTEGGVSETRALLLAGQGPLVIELGCDPRALAGGLEALILQGPRAEHGCETPIAVRAGGVDLTIDRDQVQTLFLPRGHHVLRIAGSERTVSLGAGGARVDLCPSSQP
jgi:hypothetical protein